MNQPKERLVPWLYRHFGQKEMPDGVLGFRYNRKVYPIRSIEESRLVYGDSHAFLDSRDDYYGINMTVKKTLFGVRAIFDLVDKEYFDDMRS